MEAALCPAQDPCEVSLGIISQQEVPSCWRQSPLLLSLLLNDLSWRLHSGECRSAEPPSCWWICHWKEKERGPSDPGLSPAQSTRRLSTDAAAFPVGLAPAGGSPAFRSRPVPTSRTRRAQDLCAVLWSCVSLLEPKGGGGGAT